jgi:hypothetical protein
MCKEGDAAGHQAFLDKSSHAVQDAQRRIPGRGCHFLNGEGPGVHVQQDEIRMRAADIDAKAIMCRFLHGFFLPSLFSSSSGGWSLRDDIHQGDARRCFHLADWRISPSCGSVRDAVSKLNGLYPPAILQDAVLPALLGVDAVPTGAWRQAPFLRCKTSKESAFSHHPQPRRMS